MKWHIKVYQLLISEQMTKFWLKNNLSVKYKKEIYNSSYFISKY